MRKLWTDRVQLHEKYKIFSLYFQGVASLVYLGGDEK
jgi:hypothetical protein